MSTAAAAATPALRHQGPDSTASLSISTSLAALSRLAPLVASLGASRAPSVLEIFFCTVFPTYGAILTFGLVRDNALGSVLKSLAQRADEGTVTREGVEAVVEVLSAIQAQEQGSSGGEAQLEGEDEVAQWLEGFVEVVKREVEGGQGVQYLVDSAPRPAHLAAKPSPASFASPPLRHHTKDRTLSRTKPGLASTASLPSPRSASSPPLDLAHERSPRAGTAAARDGEAESPLPRTNQLAQQLADEDEQAPTSSGGSGDGGGAATTTGRRPLGDKNGDVIMAVDEGRVERDEAGRMNKGKGKARARSTTRSRSSSPRRRSHLEPQPPSLSQLGALGFGKENGEQDLPIELGGDGLERDAPAAASHSRSAKPKPKPKPASKPRTSSAKAPQVKKAPQGLLFRGESASSDIEPEHDQLDPAPAPALAPAPAPAPAPAAGKKKLKPRARLRVKTGDDLEVDELASDVEPDTDDGEADVEPPPAPAPAPKLKKPMRMRPAAKRQQSSSGDEDEHDAPAAQRNAKHSAPRGAAEATGKKRKVSHSYSSSEGEQAEAGPSRTRRRASLSPPPASKRGKSDRQAKHAASQAASSDENDAAPASSRPSGKGKGKKPAAAVAVLSRRRAAPTAAECSQPARSSSSSAPPAKNVKTTSSSTSGAKGKTRSAAAPRSSKVKSRAEGSRSSARVAAAAASSDDEDDEDWFDAGKRAFSWHDGVLVWPSVIVSRLKGGQIAWATLPGTKLPAKIQVYISPLAIARAKLARKPHDVLLSAGQRRDIDAANAVYDDRRSLERWLRDAIAAVEEEKDKCGLEDEEEDEE